MAGLGPAPRHIQVQGPTSTSSACLEIDVKSAALTTCALLALAAFTPATPGSPATPEEEVLSPLRQRIDRLAAELARADSVYRADVEPIERMLRPFSTDSLLVRRVSLALVREARSTGLAPGLLTSVLLVENPWLDPAARSFVGAVGLMQVMPFHAGEWECESDDLENIEANICHGSRIFARLLDRSDGDVERALLRYNGCVHGRNTPDCHEYPAKVYARAGQALIRGWIQAVPSP